jgi:hypothetical protein
LALSVTRVNMVEGVILNGRIFFALPRLFF